MIWILIGLAVLAGLALIVHRGLQMKRLVDNGVVTQARVVGQHRRMSPSGGVSAPFLRYEYELPHGGTHQRGSAVSDAVWEAHPLGAHIDIVYAADKPKISAPEYLVRASREAMQRPPDQG